MEGYFDILHKDRFADLFKGTWIYDHPTDDRGKYLVLTFNFSAVDPDLDKMEISFLNHVQNNAVFFLQKYNHLLSRNQNLDYIDRTIKQSRSASDILSKLIFLCKASQQQLYVIIDEYDNFANTILSTEGDHAYQELTHGTGFFRSFFNVLKTGTTSLDSPITCSFITGVSPITMDDVTSGYNIGKNISTEVDFNRMLGFTEREVTEMIEYYRTKGLIHHPPQELLNIMTQWYGNYLFSKKNDIRLYNSDMILYFLDNYMTGKELPEDLIDRNVRIDYHKLRHLIISDKDKTIKPTANGNFHKLKEIIEEGSTSAKIVRGFPLEKLMDAENFKSLLFYLGLSDLYIIHREKELSKGFADIVMEPFLARYKGVRYSYVFEIKYIKAGMKAGDARVQSLIDKAEKQLRNYSLDEKFRKKIEKTTLIKAALIFSGHELIHMDY